MTEIEVAGHKYRASKLDPFKQFHVARRIGPILAIMGINMAWLVQKQIGKPISRAKKPSQGPGLEDFMGILPAMAEVLAKMSDADADFVLHTCLAAVQREAGENRWQVVAVNDRMMFEDIEMDVMLRLVVAVVQENIQGFLKGLGGEAHSPSSLSTSAPGATS